MATSHAPSSAATLRALTYRLSSTPSKQLPHVAPQVAAQLWNCRTLLSTTPDTAKQNDDASIAVHRFKTHLSTLLLDRTVEGRWSAVVLVKAAIEAGSVEVLSKSQVWVRSLLGILKKPDPPATRNLVVITLTRIFMLSWDYSNIVREITTPALPTFISTCLANVANRRSSTNELQTILEAFAVLIPRHPTVFRTNESHIRALLVESISAGKPTALESVHYTKEHHAIAQRLLVLLHHCAPKQGSTVKWDETLKATIMAAHTTCDRAFRSVLESWQSVAGVQSSVQSTRLVQGELELSTDDFLGLGGWKGVYAGSERLVLLLEVLEKHIVVATAGAVTVRIGLVMDLLARLLTLRVPFGKHDATRTNNQISKDERESLYLILPDLHVAALRLIDVITQRYGRTVASVVQPLLAQITWLFEAEKFDVNLRKAVYAVLHSILQLHGPSMGKADVADIEGIIKYCCQDLLPADESGSLASGSVGKGSAASDISLQTLKSSVSHPTTIGGLREIAEVLLPVCFSKLNPAYVPGRLRTLMDRTAVLSQLKDAVFASVLNPAVQNNNSNMHASLLPLLARQYPNMPEVEALLRPRMPVVKTGRSARRGNGLDERDEDEDGLDEDDENTGTPEAHDGHEPTDGLLSALSRVDDGTDGEDLISASLSHQAFGNDDQVAATTRLSSSSGRVSDKRPAEASPNFERSAKKLQVSSLGDLPKVANVVPGMGSTTGQSRVPVTAVDDEPRSSFVTAPEPSQQTAMLSSAPVQLTANITTQAAVDEGSDESDFEMPPLTMDPDTDEEESQ